MKTTLSVIKADIGSIGGHIAPSQHLTQRVAEVIASAGKALIDDHSISHTGDDIAILMVHTRGVDDEKVHKLAWDAFVAGTAVAKKEGLYGAGQDLLKDSFSGNVKGMGPAVAEMEIEERPNEPFLFFAADKTDPGAYNLPLYLAFAYAMNTPGLMLAPAIGTEMRRQGFFGAAIRCRSSSTPGSARSSTPSRRGSRCARPASRRDRTHDPYVSAGPRPA